MPSSSPSTHPPLPPSYPHRISHSCPKPYPTTPLSPSLLPNPSQTLVERAGRGELAYNDLVECYFDDDRHAAEINHICSFRCPACTKQNAEKGQVRRYSI
jgi:hypothetical protein